MFVWVKYGDSQAVRIDASSCQNVDEMKGKVKEKMPRKLHDFDLDDIFLWTSTLRDDGSLVAKEVLRPGLPCEELFDREDFKENTDEHPLLVETPDIVLPRSRTSSKSSLSKKEPHPSRKRRWDELNAALKDNQKRSKTKDSTPYSSVQWNVVKDIFHPMPYVQPRKKVPDEKLDLLLEYLLAATDCISFRSDGSEAQRQHLIAPILICVGALFKGDVKIAFEEVLDGDYVQAHGKFEFMIRRANKIVCIVEAKKEKMQQGITQDLIGCEVAAEVDGLHVVYGIVTTYTDWAFLRSSDEKVECEEISMAVSQSGPTPESLRPIVEKIYAILSDDTEGTETNENTDDTKEDSTKSAG